MGRGGAKPKRTVDPSWTPELAYASGLMATDGCLISDGRHLNLTSNDLDQLETFKQCLGISAKVSYKRSGFTKKLGSQVQFGDATLYRWFVSIGITPRKTKTIGAILVPDKYFFDYLRGEFDGDGSSHAYWDTRWRSSVSIYIDFACASKPHLEWLKETITRLIGITGIIGRYGRRPGIYQLRFSKYKAQKVYEAMYYLPSLPYLKRKKQKLDRQWAAHEMALKRLQPEGFIKNGPVIKIA